jgi:HSP20 family protein
MDFSKRFGKDFGELGGYSGRMLRTTSLARMVQLQSGSDWRPAVDVYETDDAVSICVDVAGIDVSNISLSITNSRIIIAGRRKWPLCKNLRRVHQLEIEHGYFERSVSLPVSVDVSMVTSECVDGILEIRLPKK